MVRGHFGSRGPPRTKAQSSFPSPPHLNKHVMMSGVEHLLLHTGSPGGRTCTCVHSCWPVHPYSTVAYARTINISHSTSSVCSAHGLVAVAAPSAPLRLRCTRLPWSSPRGAHGFHGRRRVPPPPDGRVRTLPLPPLPFLPIFLQSGDADHVDTHPNPPSLCPRYGLRPTSTSVCAR